ncbi:MAG: hypothetical protein ACREJ2_00235 [Planctomycetota bacterium]
MKLRQKLLLLYLANAALDSQVVSWSIYDGTGREKFEATGEPAPPYDSVLAAMKDGWRVIQVPPMPTPFPGREYSTDYLKFEFVLEKLEDIDV